MNREQYQAATAGAGLVNRAARGRILAAGKDAATYLHGLLTNDTASLKAGEGCYAAYLTAQGRMITDLWVYQLGDMMLLSMGRDVVATVLAKLDQFIFSEDVQLVDASETLGSVAVIGPRAAEILSGAVASSERAPVFQTLPAHGNMRGTFEGQPVIVAAIDDAGLRGFELVIDAAHLAPLTDALRARGAVDLDESTADILRIEAGVPLFHRDMDEETIPLEAGIESRAISLTKGCYVGQEVIIRVLHRGHGRVARKLVGLRFTGGDPIASGTSVMAGDHEIGKTASSAFSPALGHAIALAYLHRDFLASGTEVLAGGAPAVVTALPFVRRDRSDG